MRAARRVLRPLVQLFMRLGVGWRDFERVAKEAWVSVALTDYGLRGRPTNLSRVAILTGLSRREVRRIRDALAAENAGETDETHPLGRVLSAWHQDPAFAEGGRPQVLSLEGEAASFASLAARYGGDIPATALRKELLRVGAMEAVDEGHVRAVARYYLPAELSPRSVARYGDVLADLAHTLNHNVLREDPERPRFEGRAVNVSVAPEALDELRAFVEARGEQLLEEIDDWLTAKEVTDGGVRMGVGAYLIADDDNGTARRAADGPREATEA